MVVLDVAAENLMMPTADGRHLPMSTKTIQTTPCPSCKHPAEQQAEGIFTCQDSDCEKGTFELEMKVFHRHTDGVKCPGCGYRVTNKYVLGYTEQGAEKEFDNKLGLCGDCLAHELNQNDYTINN